MTAPVEWSPSNTSPGTEGKPELEKVGTVALAEPSPVAGASPEPATGEVEAAQRGMTWVLQLLQVTLAIAALAVLYLPSAERTTAEWFVGPHANFAHALPVALGALWLFFRMPSAAPDAWPRWYRAGASALIVACSLTWLLGGVVFLNAAQDLAFFVIVCTVLVVLFRPAVLGDALKPIVLLTLCLPDWKQILPALQDAAIHLAEVFLRLTSMPVLIDGYQIDVADASFHVASGCAGLREVLAGVVVGIVFAHVERLRWVATSWVVAGAILLAIVMNGLRIAVVVAIGHAIGVGSDFIQNHNWAGMVAFGIGMAVYLPALGYLIKRFGLSAPPPSRAVVRPRPRWWAFLAFLGAASVGPVLLGYAHTRAQVAPESYAILPVNLGPWTTAERGLEWWQPAFTGADASERVAYQAADGRTVVAYVATYLRQEPGREAVYYENTPGSTINWRALDSTTLRPVDHAGRLTRVEETMVKSGSTSLLVWQWFESSGAATGSRIEAKIASVLPAIRGDTAMRSVMIATSGDDRAAAEATLQSFTEALTASESASP